MRVNGSHSQNLAFNVVAELGGEGLDVNAPRRACGLQLLQCGLLLALGERGRAEHVEELRRHFGHQLQGTVRHHDSQSFTALDRLVCSEHVRARTEEGTMEGTPAMRQAFLGVQRKACLHMARQ